MRSNVRRTLSSIGLLLLCTWSSGCQLQIVIEESILQNWFFSRLTWYALVSAIVGVVAANQLCRLPIRAPLLDCITVARKRFILWIVALALLLVPISLWVDALITQPFGEGNQLKPGSVFYLVTLDWRTLTIMAVVALVFYLSVGVFTRGFFGRRCNCKYAFIPKLKS
jgi:hypothetical protein